MTTIGNLLICIKALKDYNDEVKSEITKFYAANDEQVELPETLTSNGALVYTVIDKDGTRLAHRAFLRDVSLEGMLKEQQEAA